MTVVGRFLPVKTSFSESTDRPLSVEAVIETDRTNTDDDFGRTFLSVNEKIDFVSMHSFKESSTEPFYSIGSQNKSCANLMLLCPAHFIGRRQLS